MNTVDGLSTWEQLPGSARQYRNIITGQVISRRQFMNLVRDGLPRYPGGAMVTDQTVIEFPGTGTKQTITGAYAPRVSSVRDMAMAANGGRNALPDGCSISIRLMGDLYDLEDPISVGAERIGLQTKMWDSVDAAMEDLNELIQAFRRSDPSASGRSQRKRLVLELDRVEIIKRCI